MFFKHFASKNQLPGSSISGTLVEYGLNNILQLRQTLNHDGAIHRFSALGTVSHCTKDEVFRYEFLQ